MRSARYESNEPRNIPYRGDGGRTLDKSVWLGPLAVRPKCWRISHGTLAAPKGAHPWSGSSCWPPNREHVGRWASARGRCSAPSAPCIHGGSFLNAIDDTSLSRSKMASSILDIERLSVAEFFIISLMALRWRTTSGKVNILAQLDCYKRSIAELYQIPFWWAGNENQATQAFATHSVDLVYCAETMHQGRWRKTVATKITQTTQLGKTPKWVCKHFWVWWLNLIPFLGKQILPGIVQGCVLCAGGICKGDIMVPNSDELENVDASEIDARILKCEGGPHAEKWWTFHILGRRRNIQVVWKRSGFPKNHLSSGSPCTRRRTQRRSSARLVRVSAVKHANGWRWSPKWLLDDRWDFFVVITFNQRVKTLCAERWNIRNPTRVHWCC